jgi:chemotaxis protein methyltransferase CheR
MSNVTLSDAEFRRFQSVIYRTAGIHLSHNKGALVAARLSRRLRELKVDCYGDYLDRIEASSEEMMVMLDRITINETRFFREQKQFDYLQSVVIPGWIRDAEEGRRKRALRIWSAGCATGEEPYSVAMSILSSLPDQPSWNVSIVATDLSTRALDVAVAGVWPIDRAEVISEPLLKRFMLRGQGSQRGKMKAGSEVRSVISFHRLNLNDDDYQIGDGFDLILCRNVLIYFDVDSRRRAIERLTVRLAPGAFLFVGHAETLHGVTTRVRSVAPTIYRRSIETH